MKGLQGVADWGPAQWSAAGNVATAIIALLAVIYAALQVREAKRAREAQTQPFVVVSLQPSPVANFIIELVVENIGSTLARDVSFRFDPPLKSSLDDSRLEDSYLIQHGIPTMPPKCASPEFSTRRISVRKLVIFLGDSTLRFVSRTTEGGRRRSCSTSLT